MNCYGYQRNPFYRHVSRPQGDHLTILYSMFHYFIEAEYEKADAKLQINSLCQTGPRISRKSTAQFGPQEVHEGKTDHNFSWRFKNGWNVSEQQDEDIFEHLEFYCKASEDKDLDSWKNWNVFVIFLIVQLIYFGKHTSRMNVLRLKRLVFKLKIEFKSTSKQKMVQKLLQDLCIKSNMQKQYCTIERRSKKYVVKNYQMCHVACIQYPISEIRSEAP